MFARIDRPIKLHCSVPRDGAGIIFFREQGTQLLGANRRVSKQKLVEVSETVGWRGSHSLSAQVGGNKTGRMEDNAEQTE